MSHPKLLGLGSAGGGQLGTGHRVDQGSPTPVDFRGTSDIEQIAGGGNHTLVRCADGSVWKAGSSGGESGNVGDELRFSPVHGARKSTAKPDGESVSDRYISCAATWEASILVTRANQIFVTGTGLRGELGLGEQVTNAPLLRPIECFPPTNRNVLSVRAGMRHTIAILDNGEVWGWGDGKKGQLGTDHGIEWRPVQVWTGDAEKDGFKAVGAACGKDFTIIAGEPRSGKFKILGRDSHGVVSNAPSLIEDWTDVQAGWNTIFVLKKSGTLVCWGRGDRGQIPPEHLPPLKAVAAGSEHGVGLSQNGSILAWGWGEHGNCGTDIDEDENVNNKWTVVYKPPSQDDGRYTPTGIGAGCATTWITVPASPKPQ